MTIKTSILIIAYSLGLTLLLTLSGWQISRGLDKAAVLAAESGSKRPQSLSTLPEDLTPLNYQTATLRGSWDQERIILLANRIYQSQLGYEVITPFKLSDGTWILINRGWYSQLKKPPRPPQPEHMPSGTLYFPQKGFTLGVAMQDKVLNSQHWPKESLYMDLEQFALALGQPVAPLIMVLNAGDANSLQRIWKPVVIQPERHYAYALQWFGLAIAFIIFGIIWFRRLRAKPE